MKSLGQYIAKKKTAAPKALDEKTVLFVVGQVVKRKYGEVGANRLHAQSFRSGMLIMATQSSAWREEVWVNREELLDSINQELGTNVIKTIKI